MDGPAIVVTGLRKVCWDNPVALFGPPSAEAVGRG